MKIVEKDFIMQDVDPESNFWNLCFMKRVKKRDTGQYSIEPGDILYGLTLSSALERIAKHRVAKKYEEENVTLRQFLMEYQKAHKEIIKLLRETLPENFDTGD